MPLTEDKKGHLEFQGTMFPTQAKKPNSFITEFNDVNIPTKSLPNLSITSLSSHLFLHPQDTYIILTEKKYTKGSVGR